MSEIVQLCGYFAIVFAVSVCASYLITSLRLKRKLAAPTPNGNWQLRSGAYVFRAKFQGVSQQGWIISAPISRDAYVPIRVGERLAILAPTDQGLSHFETEVILRDSATHQLTVAKPVRTSRVERRHSPRKTNFLNPSAIFEGRNATLLDLSEGGARLVTAGTPKRGERAALEISGTGKVYGWILDAVPRDQAGCVVRLRFEEALSV